MNFGDKLRELREGKGLSQKQLADATGFNQPTIARWETGELIPGFDQAQILCKALGVRVTAFDGCAFAEASEKRGRGRPKKS